MAWLAGGVSIAGLSKFVGGGLFMFTQIALARLLGPRRFRFVFNRMDDSADSWNHSSHWGSAME